MSVQAQQVFGPEVVAKEARELLELGRIIGGHAHQPYRGQMVAPQNEMQRNAGQLAGATEQWLPFLQQAQRLSEHANIGYPEQHRRYMNPYENQAVNAVTQDVSRNFTENVLPALEAQFLRRGQHGARGHREMADRAHRTMQSELLARIGQMRAHGYEAGARQHESEQNRRLALAEQMGSLGRQRQALKIADIGTLQDLGSARQQYEQTILDALYNKWLRAEADPIEKIQLRSSLLHGLPFQTSTSTVWGQQPQQKLNTLGNLGALSTALLGARRGGI